MKLTSVLFATCALAVGSAAHAADLYLPKAPPPTGSPIYDPAPIYMADLSASVGAWDTGSANSAFVDVAARIALPLGNGWEFQPEFFASHDAYDNYILANAHFYRRTGGGVIGGFVGAASDAGSGVASVGLQAATFVIANTILTGRLSHAWQNGGGWTQVGGYWDYYFDPNFKVSFDLEGWMGHGWVDSGVIGRAALTKRFDGTQLSGFVEAEAYQDAGGLSWLSGRAGLIWNFDPYGTTQYQHDVGVPFTHQSL